MVTKLMAWHSLAAATSSGTPGAKHLQLVKLALQRYFDANWNSSNAETMLLVAPGIMN